MSAEAEHLFAAEPAQPLDPLEYLVEAGKLRPEAIERARLASDQSGNEILQRIERLEFVLIRLGQVSDEDVATAFSMATGLDRVSLTEVPDEPVLPDSLRAPFLKQVCALPLSADKTRIEIAVADPFDAFIEQAVRFATKKQPLIRVAPLGLIEQALERLYGSAGELAAEIVPGDGQNEDADRLRDLASEAPVIRLVNRLIEQAVENGASDIHIEPFDTKLQVRFRLDGVLRDIETPPLRLAPAIVSRVKILAKLNIAERRLPQDGRIRIAVRGREIDFRISTTPTVHGESVVLRILDRSRLTLDFGALGFSGAPLEKYLGLLDQPHGIVLVTGPTGSGKTTTLYTSLDRLNQPMRKILTVEDPVEYLLEGVNQVQVQTEIGRGFASTLRSFLRQDPDTLMVGEIRDSETARIAVQAALTGHLVLSTVHTNDAAGGITRLLDMGIDDFLLTSTIIGLVGQRLVRTLCGKCKQPYVPSPDLVDRIGLPPDVVLHRSKGCPACRDTGFAGRTALLEVLPVSDEIRRLILEHAEAGRIKEAAIMEGMVSMYLDGIDKAAKGITSIEEVLRVTSDV